MAISCTLEFVNCDSHALHCNDQPPCGSKDSEIWDSIRVLKLFTEVHYLELELNASCVGQAIPDFGSQYKVKTTSKDTLTTYGEEENCCLR